jgi:hypothetical protein
MKKLLCLAILLVTVVLAVGTDGIVIPPRPKPGPSLMANGTDGIVIPPRPKPGPHYC